MRSVEYKYLRPNEIIDAKKKKSIVYLPIGPLEWHGPAMPFGTDPMLAEYSAIQVAKRIGGVVMPTVFIGTERERKPEMLEAFGFEDTSQYIVGQDFPKNSIESFYTKEDVFGLIVREHLRMLVNHGYDMILIFNGHGATNQIETLDRLACELTNESNSRVEVIMSFTKMNDSDNDFGHATLKETAAQMALDESNVDISQLPPRHIKLKNCDWGIDDAATFKLRPNGDKTVIYDPRDATLEHGQLFLRLLVEDLALKVERKWSLLTSNR